jgi:hypothetical protein
MNHEHTWQYFSYGTIAFTEVYTEYKFICHCGATKVVRAFDYVEPVEPPVVKKRMGRPPRVKP